MAISLIRKFSAKIFINHATTGRLMKNVYILSDATGETAERVVRAALPQFAADNVRVRRLPQVFNQKDVQEAMAIASYDPGMVIFTLVDPVLSQTVQTMAEESGLITVDLMSSLLYSISMYLGESSQAKPGLQYRIDTDYHKRIEAVNFTVKHDDGQEVRNLHKADLVLVGVSRSSKTPLSIYLAHKGYKVANVPIVRGIEPPEELFKVSQDRVVGLLIDPRRLVEIRSSRLLNMQQTPRGTYVDYQQVEDEINYCRQLFRKNPQWLVINITNKSVEESASEIIRKTLDSTQQQSY